MKKEEFAKLGDEIRKHSEFQEAFEKAKRSYSEILGKAGLSPEVSSLRLKAAQCITIPLVDIIQSDTPIYSMEKVSDSAPIDYYGLAFLVQRDFPDYVAENRIHLQSMSFLDIDALSTELYAKKGVSRPDTNSISLPLFHQEQIHALVDLIRILNQSGTYHGDLHQGNVLIEKKTVS